MYINTDNIIFEKVWDDYNGYNHVGDWFQINVNAYNSFVKINNFNFYMDKKTGKELSKFIDKYIQHNEAILYENKNSVYNNEIMRVEIKPVDVHGHVIINLKIENSDSNGKKILLNYL